MAKKDSYQKISVLVPRNPFVSTNLQEVKHCLAALDVVKLMDWWPGKPHTPHRDSNKVRDIQRSLDWKRVTQIASYLLQSEIMDAPGKLDKYFRSIYEPRRLEPGREWPPRVPKVVGFERSQYPTFSNVLLHVNGARVSPIGNARDGAAHLEFDENSKDLHFSVIDGQHRINGAYLAMMIRLETNPNDEWDIPAEIFLDLDALGAPPRHQAQIFIDVNFYQKKVDRSLVADLFPTARGNRGAIDEKERAQDIGRKLMLEVGPLVGMIQIPGIKFGVQDVVALATLNSAIEDVLGAMDGAGITSLEEQTEFLAQCLEAWLEATGRKHDLNSSKKLDPSNVAYQGRVLVSFLTLLPACIWTIRRSQSPLVSEDAQDALVGWFKSLMGRAGLLDNGKFITKNEFRRNGYLGSGGLGRFRDTLWAATIGRKDVSTMKDEQRTELAERNKSTVWSDLAKQ